MNSIPMAQPAPVVPGQPVPAQAYPAQAYPAQAIPAQAVPGQPVPAQAYPNQAVPAQAIPAEPLAAAIPAESPPPIIQGYGTFGTPVDIGTIEIPKVEGEVKEIQIGAVVEETLNDSILREALGKVATQHCCWNKKVVELMSIKDVQNSNAYDVRWETWLEKRSTQWKSEPYSHQNIDSPQNGVAPGPWNMSVSAPPSFTESVVKVRVPHTDSVGRCEDCYGYGYKTCTSCRGQGYTYCSSCNGSGRRSDGSPCSFCNHGTNRCHSCNGRGTNTCHTCNGNGRVVNFVELKVSFVCPEDHSVIDTSGIPDACVKKAQGVVICQDMGYVLNPPQNSSDQRINDACVALSQQAASHINADQTRLLQQRVTVTYVPVTRCVADYSDKEFAFYAYGTDNDGYCDEYPATCCGCCTIM